MPNDSSTSDGWRGRKIRSGVATASLACCLIAACATHRLPNTRSFGVDYYPSASRRLAEEGRVLVEFHVNEQLRPVEMTIPEASGSERLDAGAMRVVHAGIFEDSDRIKPKPGILYRATIIFCLQPGRCDGFAPFPDTIPVTVKAEPIHMESLPHF